MENARNILPGRRLRTKLLAICIALSSCSKLEPPSDPDTGDLIGKVQFFECPNGICPDQIEVTIGGRTYTLAPGPSQLIEIPNLQPGIYDLSAGAEGLGDITIRGVEISRDSVSMIPLLAFLPMPGTRDWYGIKIRRAHMNVTGDIAGRAAAGGRPIVARVTLEGTFWVTHSDSAGEYVLLNIPVGQDYALRSSQPPPPPDWYWSPQIRGIRVAPDSVSTVNIPFHGPLTPRPRHIIYWEEDFRPRN